MWGALLTITNSKGKARARAHTHTSSSEVVDSGVQHSGRTLGWHVQGHVLKPLHHRSIN